MIQVNLLPDVKSKYIKIERTKRLTTLSALVICGIAIGVTIILAGIVYGVQKTRLNSLNTSIKQNTDKLQKVEDLDKILTIQNQLVSLTGLHDSKPVVSRLFTYLPQVTPDNSSVAETDIKFIDNSISLTGSAPSMEVVNKFTDTLKFTKYHTDQSPDQVKAFSAVVLSTFSVTTKENGAPVVLFTIKANFDPLIFSGSYKAVTLVVPEMVTTRSQTEQPDMLYQEQPAVPTTNNDTQGATP